MNNSAPNNPNPTPPNPDNLVDKIRDLRLSETRDDYNSLEDSIVTPEKLDSIWDDIKSMLKSGQYSYTEKEIGNAILYAGNGDPIQSEWIANEIGTSLSKLENSENPFDEEDILEDALEELSTSDQREVVPTSPETPEPTPEDNEEEDLPDQTPSKSSVEIIKRLDRDQMTVLDAVRGKIKDYSVQGISLYLADKIISANKKAREWQAKSEKAKKAGGKMNMLKGFSTSMIAKMSARNGSGAHEGALKALGLSREELTSSPENVRQLVLQKVEKMFSSEEDKEALQHSLNFRGDVPKTKEEKDLGISLRDSIEDWAHGTPDAQKYAQYLSKGGTLEFNEWADSNVPWVGMKRLFGMFKSWARSMVGMPIFGKWGEKMGTPKENDILKKYKESEGVQRLKEQQEIVANWDKNAATIQQIKNYNTLLGKEIQLSAFQTINNKEYPVITPKEYDEKLEENIGGEKNPIVFKNLLIWIKTQNKEATDLVPLEKSGLDFLKNNPDKCRLDLRTNTLYYEDKPVGVKELNGIAEKIRKRSEWSKEGEEVKKLKEEYLGYQKLFTVFEGSPLPTIQAGKDLVPDMSVGEYKVLVEKNRKLFDWLKKGSGTKPITKDIWDRFNNLKNYTPSNNIEVIKDVSNVSQSPFDRLGTLLLMNTVISAGKERSKPSPFLKISKEGKLQYLQSDEYDKEGNYKRGSQWTYAMWKSTWNIETYMKKIGMISKESASEEKSPEKQKDDLNTAQLYTPTLPVERYRIVKEDADFTPDAKGEAIINKYKGRIERYTHVDEEVIVKDKKNGNEKKEKRLPDVKYRDVYGNERTARRGVEYVKVSLENGTSEYYESMKAFVRSERNTDTDLTDDMKDGFNKIKIKEYNARSYKKMAEEIAKEMQWSQLKVGVITDNSIVLERPYSDAQVTLVTSNEGKTWTIQGKDGIYNHEVGTLKKAIMLGNLLNKAYEIVENPKHKGSGDAPFELDDWGFEDAIDFDKAGSLNDLRFLADGGKWLKFYESNGFSGKELVAILNDWYKAEGKDLE